MSNEDLLHCGMSVRQLRSALHGIDDDLVVTISSDDFCGGILSANVEDNCGGLHFSIFCSDEEDDFIIDAEMANEPSSAPIAAKLVATTVVGPIAYFTGLQSG